MSLTPPRQQIASFFSQGFDQQVTLQAPVDVPDGQGGSVRTWPAQFDEMASLNILTAVERLSQGAADANYTHRALLGFRSEIKPTWRLLLGTRVFAIHTVTDYGEKHIFTELMIEEKFAS